MTEQFSFDVFLSHSAKDKPIVRPIAERLRDDGLKVWFDEWVLKPDDNAPAKIEQGLEHSRVLLLCISANTFGSEWAQLESQTFRFRDPLNRDRRFIPLRLGDAPINTSVAQSLDFKWFSATDDNAYEKLLEICRPPTKPKVTVPTAGGAQTLKTLKKSILLDNKICTFAFRPDGEQALTADFGNTMRLWDTRTGRCLRVFTGHGPGGGLLGRGAVLSVAWANDGRRAFSIGEDIQGRVWDLETGQCLSIVKPSPGEAYRSGENGLWCFAWSPDGLLGACGDRRSEVSIWSIRTGERQALLTGHTADVKTVAWSNDQRLVISGSDDRTVRIWDVRSGRTLRILEGHKGKIRTLAPSSDGLWLISTATDATIRLWEISTGKCLAVFEGHEHSVVSAAWSPDQQRILSGDIDGGVRVWNVATGRCMVALTGHEGGVRSVAWSSDGFTGFSYGDDNYVRLWDLSDVEGRAVDEPARPVTRRPDQIQYTNAKVLLVGESGAGKTGLSKRLTSNMWEPSDSTVGAWATQWKLPIASSGDIEREIWLWDFGGQADQRLIHQLYMDETALAVLVFDGQKEDLFEALSQWDRDLTRAAGREFAKLLVAGRVDAGGLRVSRSDVEKFAAERKFKGFLETSAKKNLGCEELQQAILAGIDWDQIPCRTTEALFKRLKEEIIRLKDEGRVLMRFNELRENLQLRLSGEFERFADEELRTVLTLLAGPCVVWELSFGSWVLLQPERINAYAQAVIRTLQEDEQQRGCLMEERVFNGDLAYESSMERLEGDEERFVLLAMHQTLLERGLCLRQSTPKGNLLVFPSYYRRERPDQVKFPAVLVSYGFTGFLDDVYATLVVRLHHHTESFQPDKLWRYAADFKTNTGKQLGIKLLRIAPGSGELEVYFDPAVSIEEKIIFSKYVHEHLLQHAREVQRLRHYVCECGTPVGNREVAMKRLNDWLQIQPSEPEIKKGFIFKRAANKSPTIICVSCEKRVALWDEMEQSFASPEIQQRVREMQAESAIVLDNESRERVLVGEVISTVALAGQLCREFNVSDHGIDMEIEFKDDAHEATARKLYLQLKSGDSYTRRRKRDGAQIFTIKDERHVRYWMAQAFPVLLVVRNSAGEVQWMEVRDWLKRASENGTKPVKQIVFEGERFDVMSVRRWRDRVLGDMAQPKTTKDRHEGGL